MSDVIRFPWLKKPFVQLATLLLAMGVVGGAVAKSALDAEYEYTVRQLTKAKQKVLDLEERVRELEFKRAQRDQPDRAVRLGSVRRLGEQQRSLTAGCGEPFVIDESGIKRLRSGCSADELQGPYLSPQAETEASCAMPFWMDERGIKRLRQECTSGF